jgi:hypothetical protein
MEALMSNPATHIDNDGIEFGDRKSMSLKALFVMIASVIAAMRAGLNSMHKYEDLRAHGVSHAVAAKEACEFKP